MKKLFIIALAVIGTSLFVACDKDENIKNLPNEIKSFITEHYPNSTVIEFDLDRTDIEVDILHDNLHKDLKFSKSNVWLLTSWDILVSALPKEVTESIVAKYPTMRLDEADFYETPSLDYYLVELEPGDVKIKVKADGTIVK